MTKLSAVLGVFFVMTSLNSALNAADPAKPWPAEKAVEWQRIHPWLVGFNYIPSKEINQLEMWQADTFDLATNDKELGLAEDLGFTCMRVFLHHIPWQQDREGFLKRIDQFLGLCEKHHIGVMFVPLDSCWDPYPKAGPQREPKPHVHNSGWVQCPGADILKDSARHDELESYIKGVINHFKNDKRVYIWDLYNEPDNKNNPYEKTEIPNKVEASVALIQKAYTWAREINPSQPLTSGVWVGNWADPSKLNAMEKIQLEQSDVISFHNYAKIEDMKKCVENLKRYKRPILCTEYMARPQGSTFDPILGYLKEQKVGAFNWGFVSGKTQTIYPWDSWKKTYTAEPPLWFHDIFRTDGQPYIEEEVKYIKTITGKTKP